MLPKKGVKVMDAYKIINELNEAERFKRLIAKWDRLYHNMQVFPHEKPILLPDIFWIGPSGSGTTKLIRLMAEYLKDKPRLMEFSGQVMFFEFLLNYCPENAPMIELARFADEIEWAAGYKSEFKGIINIDVSEWLNHSDEKNFLVFLEFLSVNSRNWLIILSVEKDDEELILQMESVISMFLRIERIKIEVPKTDSLLKKIMTILSGYALSLDESAQELLKETIDTLKKNRYFDGYKTIEMLAQDIIYDNMSERSENISVLSASHLSAFTCDGDYVRKAIQAKTQLNRIGFVSNSEE